MSQIVARKSRSREPASRSIAALTVALVVSGPGVNSSLLVVMSEVLQFVAIAVERVGQAQARNLSVRRRLPDALAAQVSGIDDDVFDGIGSGLARVLAQHR